MLTHDQILNELIEQLRAKKLKGKDVAAHLGIAPARVTEMTKRDRQIQPREMAPLAAMLGLIDAGDDEIRSNARVIPMEGASLEKPHGNLPIYGTALAAAKRIEGEAIEQTELNKSNVIEYAKRPPLLNGRADAYGLHIQGSSMHPALPDGEMVAVAPGMPLSVGDNVVVYLRTDDPDEDDGQTARAVLVKELVRRSATAVILRQYSPAGDFSVDMSEVLRIDRVLTRREMMS